MAGSALVRIELTQEQAVTVGRICSLVDVRAPPIRSDAGYQG
ncbi:MAG TPA: hypothetical protein VEG68_16475 [Terriglobales bacterium]|nr:hypothetical protein [Terriglobales bacterium]